MIELKDYGVAVGSGGPDCGNPIVRSLGNVAGPILRRLLVIGFVIFPNLMGLGVHGSDPARESAVNLDADPHLVGWWKFDETTGSTAADSAKPAHPATLEGGVTFDSRSMKGRLGKAIQLEGNNDGIRVKGFKGVTGSGPRTVAVWVKTKETSGDLITWGTNEAGKMFVFGHIRGRIGVTPKGGYLYMNADINDDKWHHVAIVIQEGSPPNLHDHAQLFLDGKPIEPDGIGLLDMLPFETGDQQDVKIGPHFKGALDDLRIYDRALMPDEVQTLAALAQ